ncbi:hypothetical protein IG631_15058 [Alternaria alternata]|nr:hypothetical protein IG631_15058 [Alternaria alternata]
MPRRAPSSLLTRIKYASELYASNEGRSADSDRMAATSTLLLRSEETATHTVITGTSRSAAIMASLATRTTISSVY